MNFFIGLGDGVSFQNVNDLDKVAGYVLLFDSSKCGEIVFFVAKNDTNRIYFISSMNQINERFDVGDLIVTKKGKILSNERDLMRDHISLERE